MLDTIKNILTRFGPSGGLILGGLILIIYIAMGFLYFQQGGKQKEFEEQINSLSAVVARPLDDETELKEEYLKTQEKLAPMSDSEAIARLVGIAEQNGIYVSGGSDYFRVPPAAFSEKKIGEVTYRLIIFRGISVQGEYENVINFIQTIDSGSALETMVLQRISISEKAILLGEDEPRQSEYHLILEAIDDMMNDNGLSAIPNPVASSGGIATNFMGDDPNTEGIFEGFPDPFTTVAAKGYTGTDFPEDGYLLYRHDKIPSDDPAEYETVDYFPELTTDYYYTCEPDGTLHQWDGPDLSIATEFATDEEPPLWITATVDVVIYTKP
ncbi:hypothetical protein ACFLW0_03460 [Chloroflexota bacterium]